MLLMILYLYLYRLSPSLFSTSEYSQVVTLVQTWEAISRDAANDCSFLLSLCPNLRQYATEPTQVFPLPLSQWNSAESLKEVFQYQKDDLFITLGWVRNRQCSNKILIYIWSAVTRLTAWSEFCELPQDIVFPRMAREF